MKMRKICASLCAGSALLSLSACDGGPGNLFGGEKVEVVETEYPEQVLWGDTHLHTANSPDAFGWGVRLDAEAALRFASGEKVTSTMGVDAKLDRPLDFLVISDHSDGLGFTKMIAEAPRFLLPNEQLKRWHDMFNAGPEESTQAMNEMIDLAGDPEASSQVADPEEANKQGKEIWDDHIEVVDDYNAPGKFTAFNGFEYTSMPDGNNLHRVVMFRDGADKVGTITPFPSASGETPYQLWQYMAAYEKDTGGRVLAIPHNSNVSNGLMFETTGTPDGPMSVEEATLRQRMEPIVETTQIKGDSETHPYLSPNDEFAAFGVAGWDKANISAKIKMTEEMFAGSYVRSALKRGLEIEKQIGVNPYKLGQIGSTDSHTALATGDEENFFGKHTFNEPTPEGRDRVNVKMNLGSRGNRFNWHYLAGGYAAVWATANTREAIFDAMARRETYATTGPRMTVRFFGGFDFTDEDMTKDWVKEGYSRGVPMGGDLNATDEKAPSFIVSAMKDPEGANLDRVQVVKGWIDGSGNTQEKVFDVAWSDMENRMVAGGKVPTVGNTVDLKTAEYENSIGTGELQTVWSDPEFDPAVKAFYYVRVLEIPTPRWVLFDAIRYKITLPEETTLVTQERAYTSPIWYNPKA